jgi:hypothetical protein
MLGTARFWSEDDCIGWQDSGRGGKECALIGDRDPTKFAVRLVHVHHNRTKQGLVSNISFFGCAKSASQWVHVQMWVGPREVVAYKSLIFNYTL